MTGEKKQVKVAVLGATGYTGIELIRLLLNHPGVEIAFLSSESYSHRPLAEAHPQFSGWDDLFCSPLEPEAIPAEVEMVFCALPHGRSVEVVPALLARGFRVVDLSADFRLKDPSLYPLWYDYSHPHPELLNKSVYGLPELYRGEVEEAALLANPGCYPTGILLALAPLMEAGLVQGESLVIDAKSGVSGAGRAARQPFHFPECSESFKAYRLAAHQHTPEIEQELTFLAAGKTGGKKEGVETGGGITVTFTPHLIPINRGILSTIYLFPQKEQREAELRELYRSFYREDFFVRLLDPPLLPETRWVRGTNFCHMALRLDERTGRVILVSAIDNLVKGAAGQAIQNMNIMCGWPEETGLKLVALVP